MFSMAHFFCVPHSSAATADLIVDTYAIPSANLSLLFRLATGFWCYWGRNLQSSIANVCTHNRDTQKFLPIDVTTKPKTLSA